MRLLLLIVLAVGVSVGVTAWVAVLSADRLEDSVEDEAFAAAVIFDDLTLYAATHGDWSGVGEFLRDRSDEFGQRIALTTMTGTVLADTEPTDAEGSATRLPRAPTDLIVLGPPTSDEFNPCAPFEGERVEEIELFVENGFGETEIFGCVQNPAPSVLLYLGFGESGASGVALPSGTNLRIGIAAIIVAIVVGGVTVLASRRILAPVAELTMATGRMAEGRLEERVEAVGEDEIGRLGQAFNAMAASLEESEAERRTLTSDIAHELRTPLSNIRGYLEAVQDGVVEATPELVAGVHEEALLLQQLVDDLQTLSLAEAGHLRLNLEEVDLAALAEQVVASHRARAESAGVELRVDAAVVPSRRLDATRTRQALGNLIENSLRHTPAGGQITVSTAVQDRVVQLSVADDGEGIAAEHLDHVFDRFYRADPSRARATGGSGLGLAIVQKLVQAQGADVTISSSLGEGTTVTLLWPG